ncbi:MAG: DUF1501 domain-containing protein [Verrucomicrobiota bacterium]
MKRREFLGSACCAAVGTTGMLSALAQLRATAAAASLSSFPPSTAAAVPNDYRALVCIFLQGGNDASNLIIPTGSGYAGYANARSVIAIPQANVLSLSPKTTDGRSFGLHPSFTEIHNLFGQGKAALMANVGSLVEPTTKAQYTGGTVKLPPQLFSHNDQQVQWQSSIPDRPFQSGWGGRAADLLNSLNVNNQVSMSVSLNGFNNFQVGDTVTQLAVTPASPAIPKGGPVAFASTTGGNNPARYAAQKELFSASGTNPSLFASAFGALSKDAIDTSELLGGVLNAAPNLATTFPATTLGNQLKTIAYLISIASSLNLKRQVFFARIGGWDTHADQVDEIDRAMGAHAGLLQQVSQGINAFYNATVELGCADRVTTFTASDFGRTYTSNGDGSDHGWGSHHVVVGGAVKGGDIYGRMPTLTVGGPDDTTNGRWIPTTSVDEYGATLARWFGVTDTNLSVAFPNLGRFAKPNLGFV